MSAIPLRKRVEVVAAVICGDGKVLAAQRGYGDMRGGWEFPGGKVEPGESLEEALHREIREELAADILVGRLLHTVEWDYPAFHLTMHCFLCRLDGDTLQMREHQSLRWLARDELETVGWLPADRDVVDMLYDLL